MTNDERRARLDVTPWSLSLPMLALVACSIAVEPPAEDAGGSGEGGSGDGASDGVVACVDASDCPAGEVCVDGECRYEQCGGCSCAVARPDGDRFRCPGGYYDCYSDSDCYEGQYCDIGQCRDRPQEDPCATLPQIEQSYSLVFNEPGEIGKLFFASTGDDIQGLLAVRDTAVIRPSIDGEVVVVEDAAAITDAIVYDLDGDADLDLLTATGGETPAITMWLAGESGFSPVVATPGIPGIALQVAMGEWDGDGVADLFVRTLEGVHVAPLLDASVGMLGEAAIVADATDSMALADVDGNGTSDLVLRAADRFEVLHTGDGAVLQLPADATPTLDSVVGDFDGDDVTDLLSVTTPFTMYVWRGSLFDAPQPTTGVHESSALAIAAGHIGSTPAIDAVVTRAERRATIYYGGGYDFVAPGLPFVCDVTIDLPIDGTRVAIGDVDQDGDSDLVVTDGTDVAVVRQQ